MQLANLLVNVITILLSLAFGGYSFIVSLNVDKSRMLILFFVLLVGFGIWIFDAVWNVFYILANALGLLKSIAKVFGYFQSYFAFELNILYILAFWYCEYRYLPWGTGDDAYLYTIIFVVVGWVKLTFTYVSAYNAIFPYLVSK